MEAYSYEAEDAHIVNLSIGDIEGFAFFNMRPEIYESLQTGIRKVSFLICRK